ncbi:hypothetical protein ACIRP0_28335 [Streptomyces sp. NPDC101733]|uniref:hypothetical protein n=1 Tax=unclassified Streptomyces TaxID=2593676 RepID=UPI0037F2DA4A
MTESVLSLATTPARIRALAEERQLDVHEMTPRTTLHSLENGSDDLMAGDDPMACLVDRYGLLSLSTRGRPLTRTQETLLLGMITGMLSAEVVR